MITTRLLLVFVSIAFTANLAWAETPAEERLHKAVEQTISVAEQASSSDELMQKVRPVLEKNMSFPAMTRRAIGPTWRQFTPEQQKKAIGLFTDLIIRRYAGRFTIGEHPTNTFKPATTPEPGRMEVPSLLLYKGSRYEVVYRLEQTEDWRITDIVIEGVSFVGNYRSQFNEQAQKGGPDAVLASLTKAVENP